MQFSNALACYCQSANKISIGINGCGIKVRKPRKIDTFSTIVGITGKLGNKASRCNRTVNRLKSAQFSSNQPLTQNPKEPKSPSSDIYKGKKTPIHSINKETFKQSMEKGG
ncbi:hypothetical protein GOBAR_DD14635 [Gossypium barbadense]|nr:hypothetical protein GOBAR_DD14635 [Gossypium barbadense]